MNPSEIIGQAMAEGVILVLSPTGTIKATGDQPVVDKWLPMIRDNKTGILCELQREYRRAKVLALLEGKRFALFVDDDKTDPVIAAVGIRDLATFELAIPKHSYDGMVLLELIEKHYGEKHANS
ncbi:MAG: hypothetical protein JSR64_16645 [Nitrospira sp.]|nr:hypothetical protein [Nitrospira sp.]MBS0587662.1 hypothetical protein [Pseudomonadota bacterium]